jgi:hypothetical protein
MHGADLFDPRGTCAGVAQREQPAHPADGGSTPPARSPAPPPPRDEDLIFDPDPAIEEAAPGPALDGAPPAAMSDALFPASGAERSVPEDVGAYIALAASLYASPAAQAFLERRLALQAKHGGGAVTDLSRGAAAIAGNLLERAQAVRERLARNRAPSRGQLEAAAAALATCGALALALHDAIAAALAAAPGEDPRR